MRRTGAVVLTEKKYMRYSGFLLTASLAVGIFFSFACPVERSNGEGTLKAFSSEKELKQWLQKKKKAFENEYQKGADATSSSSEWEVAFSPVEADSVTNTQTEGVDEGGIVKLHGEHLVILRRGRLFSVDTQNDSLKPVSVVDAFAPGSSGHAWYDEMLISDNTVVVIGYSYQKQGTEVVLFHIDEGGVLSYESTYILRSNDYYSSRNYASRLVGSKLIFYTPLYLDFYGDPLDNFPAMRRWQENQPAEFIHLAPATKIYRGDDGLEPNAGIALHTVHTCELAAKPMECTARGILAPPGREFYVSQEAVYIWTVHYSFAHFSEDASYSPVHSALFRFPLDESQAPTSLKTMGSPIDQFSFLESDGHLNVLLRAEGKSASMWSSEVGSKNLALLRIHTEQLGNGTSAAPLQNYYPLPEPEGGWSIQNRYVGDYLLYGAGETWRPHGNEAEQSSYILNWQHPHVAPVLLPIKHSVDRIEALGRYPLLVGSKDGNLHFSAISASLEGPESGIQAELLSEFVLEAASQGETRSHGFFYRASDDKNGILGLPFRGGGASGWQQLWEASQGIVYLRNHQLKLGELGRLDAKVPSHGNDNCKASCVDWYGNSRPLFLGTRIFALMGYELIEGKLEGDQMREIRRVDFTPQTR
ncbi:MAG: beta-propeller domain-containing protein [Cystobacterineae bacterium]|nr:beta-propeller domain-containing protein [Cystobacterineae bacterium]